VLVTALLAILGLIARPWTVTGQTWILGNLEPGAQAMGLRIIQTTATGRPLEDGRPRPLQVWLWYPASEMRQPAREALTCGDYCELAETELGERITKRLLGASNRNCSQAAVTFGLMYLRAAGGPRRDRPQPCASLMVWTIRCQV